jgi:hypothetical protein
LASEFFDFGAQKFDFRISFFTCEGVSAFRAIDGDWCVLFLAFGAWLNSGARQMPKGRLVGSEQPDLKIMDMIPADGTPIALAKIRKIATGIPYRMSASTLTNCLKELTEAGKLRRTVDASGGRPHYVYNRTLVPTAKSSSMIGSSRGFYS